MTDPPRGPRRRDVLRELSVEERAKADRMLAAATVWQAHAVPREQQFKQLTAGDQGCFCFALRRSRNDGTVGRGPWGGA